MQQYPELQPFILDEIQQELNFFQEEDLELLHHQNMLVQLINIITSSESTTHIQILPILFDIHPLLLMKVSPLIHNIQIFQQVIKSIKQFKCYKYANWIQFIWSNYDININLSDLCLITIQSIKYNFLSLDIPSFTHLVTVLQLSDNLLINVCQQLLKSNPNNSELVNLIASLSSSLFQSILNSQYSPSLFSAMSLDIIKCNINNPLLQASIIHILSNIIPHNIQLQFAYNSLEWYQILMAHSTDQINAKLHKIVLDTLLLLLNHPSLSLILPLIPYNDVNHNNYCFTLSVLSRSACKDDTTHIVIDSLINTHNIQSECIRHGYLNNSPKFPFNLKSATPYELFHLLSNDTNTNKLEHIPVSTIILISHYLPFPILKASHASFQITLCNHAVDPIRTTTIRAPPHFRVSKLLDHMNNPLQMIMDRLKRQVELQEQMEDDGMEEEDMEEEEDEGMDVVHKEEQHIPATPEPPHDHDMDEMEEEDFHDEEETEEEDEHDEDEGEDEDEDIMGQSISTARLRQLFNQLQDQHDNQADGQHPIGIELGHTNQHHINTINVAPNYRGIRNTNHNKPHLTFVIENIKLNPCATVFGALQSVNRSDDAPITMDVNKVEELEEIHSMYTVTDTIDPVFMAVCHILSKSATMLEINNYLSLLFKLQSTSYYTAQCHCIPSWMSHILQSIPSIILLDYRLDLIRNKPIKGHKRKIIKYAISRDNIPSSLIKIMENSALDSNKQNGISISYLNEIGSGVGLTNEFYSIGCSWFQSQELGLFNDKGYPMPSHDANNHYLWYILGIFIGQGLKFEVALDLEINAMFLKMVLRGTLYGIEDLYKIIPDVMTVISECKSGKYDVETLCISWFFPGTSVLLKDGMDKQYVTTETLNEYTESLQNALFGSGIAEIVKSFKSGLNTIIPMEVMVGITADELYTIMTTSYYKQWTKTGKTSTNLELIANIECGAGILIDEPLYNMFIDILHGFNKAEQGQFLMFISGSKKLMNNKWTSLDPKLKIVVKDEDGGLPSVMTCAHYLKIRRYLDFVEFRRELVYAMTEGSEFHLS